MPPQNWRLSGYCIIEFNTKKEFYIGNSQDRNSAECPWISRFTLYPTQNIRRNIKISKKKWMRGVTPHPRSGIICYVDAP
jgi:hypothetical protein